VRGAGRHGGERRQPLLARRQPARLGQLGVALGQGDGDPAQEVDDERRRHAERDPHADHPVVVGDLERLVGDEQDAEPDER
jgi:hypothetical protein